MASCGLGGALKLNLEAKSGELGNQALGLGFGRTAIEVVGPEVVVFGAVLEDVVDRREDRGGDGTNCFLRSAPGLQPEELGFVIAVLLSLGRPCALDQHRLPPGPRGARRSGTGSCRDRFPTGSSSPIRC